MEKSAELLDKWAQAFAKIAEQYGPRVSELALDTARVAAINSILFNLIWLLCSVGFLLVFGKRMVRFAKDYQSSSDGMSWGGVFIPLCGATLIAVAALASLINPYLWVGLFRPEVFLAAKAIGWL